MRQPIGTLHVVAANVSREMQMINVWGNILDQVLDICRMRIKLLRDAKSYIRNSFSMLRLLALRSSMSLLVERKSFQKIVNLFCSSFSSS